MKMTLRPLLGTISSVLFIWSCQEQKKDTTQDPKQQQEKPVTAPESIISLEQADAIYENYSKHRVEVITQYETQTRAPEQTFIPARFVDFDYQTLKQYLKYVEQEAKKANVEKISTLRLYFANYPNEQKFPDGKRVVHPRQNSIFMLPTMDINGENEGFYIGTDGKAKLISDWKTDQEEGLGGITEPRRTYASMVPNISLNTNLYGGTSLVLNRGNGGPPPKTDF
jgi:hypothetical protein